MISGDATAAQILGARDAGVHEFMRRPYTMGDLQKRLEAVSGRPRDWIEAIHYVGPDRRRFNSADYKGPTKRRTDGPIKTQKLSQALKIIINNSKNVSRRPECRRLSAKGRPNCKAAAVSPQATSSSTMLTVAASARRSLVVSAKRTAR